MSQLEKRVDEIERLLKRLAEENLRRAQEDRKRAEEERKRAEEERKRAEEERKRAEEERKRAEEERRRAEDDRKRAEEFEQQRLKDRKEWEERHKRLEQALGHLGNGIGRLSEGIIAPNLQRLLRQVNIRFTGIRTRVQAQRLGESLELDLLATGNWRGGGNVVVAVEVSTHLRDGELDRALAKFSRFFEFFPEYREYELIGSVAGMQLEAGTARRAEEAGLLVIAPSGETARLLNARPIRPRIWRA